MFSADGLGGLSFFENVDTFCKHFIKLLPLLIKKALASFMKSKSFELRIVENYFKWGIIFTSIVLNCIVFTVYVQENE